jgi:transcriptional regulator with XRE-family HTH domain
MANSPRIENPEGKEKVKRLARPQPETLQELVRAVLDEQAISGRELARRAGQHNLRVSYTTINNLAQGRHTGNVSEETLKAIAVVGRVSEKRVRAAAGVPPLDESTDPQLLALHRELSPEEKREGLRMYREWVRSMKRMRG